MPLLAELSQCSLRCFLAVDFSQKYGKIIHVGGDSYADGEEGMLESMKEVMADATTEKEREIIRDAMSKLEKA